MCRSERPQQSNAFSPQILAQDLADIAFRQGVDEFDDGRYLVAGEPLAHESPQRRVVEVRIAADDKKLHGLAAAWVRHADRGRLAHARILHGDIFDLAGKRLKPRDIDHVFLAVKQSQKTVRIESADVAGVEPAVGGQHLLGLLRPLPIAEHYLRAAHANLAGFARPQVPAMIVADRYLGGGQRQPDRTLLRREEWIDADDRRGLGEAIAFHDLAAGDFAPALSDLALDRGAAAHRNTQIGKIDAGKFRIVYQRVEQCVHPRHPGDLRFAHGADKPVQIARIWNENVHPAQT